MLASIPKVDVQCACEGDDACSSLARIAVAAVYICFSESESPPRSVAALPESIQHNPMVFHLTLALAPNSVGLLPKGMY